MKKFIKKYELHMLNLVFGLSLGFLAGKAIKIDDAAHGIKAPDDMAAAGVFSGNQVSHLAVSERNTDDGSFPKEELRYICIAAGRRGSFERSAALLGYLKSEKRDVPTILNDVSFLINEGQMDSVDLAVVGEWAATQGDIVALDDFLQKFSNIENLRSVKSNMAETFLDSISEEIANGRKLDEESLNILQEWLPNGPLNFFVYKSLLAKNVDLAKVYKGDHFTETDSGFLDTLEMRKSIQNNGISSLVQDQVNDYIKSKNSKLRSFISAAFWGQPLYSRDGLTNLLGQINHEKILSNVQLAMDVGGLASKVDPLRTVEWVASLPEETRGPALNQLFNTWVKQDPNAALNELKNITFPLSNDEQVNILLGIRSADHNLSVECDELLKELGVSDVPNVTID